MGVPGMTSWKKTMLLNREGVDMEHAKAPATACGCRVRMGAWDSATCVGNGDVPHLSIVLLQPVAGGGGACGLLHTHDICIPAPTSAFTTDTHHLHRPHVDRRMMPRSNRSWVS